MKQTLRAAVVASIAHWNRMIAYAQKQKPRGTAMWESMNRALHEDWFSDDCPLCTLFYSGSCADCPITPNCNRESSLWNRVIMARTWATWLERAVTMRNYLATLVK
jgi:hypothetical protein